MPRLPFFTRLLLFVFFGSLFSPILSLNGYEIIDADQPVNENQNYLIASWNFNEKNNLDQPQEADLGIGVLTSSWDPGSISYGRGETVGLYGPVLPGFSLVLENGPGNLNEGKGLTFQISTKNRDRISASYVTRRSSSGFVEQHWSWSLDGVDFTPLKTITLPDNLYGPSVSFPPDIADSPEVYIRIEFKGLPENPEPDGFNRIDNLIVIGRGMRQSAGLGEMTVINATPGAGAFRNAFQPDEEQILELEFKRSSDEGESTRFESISSISIEFPAEWPELDPDMVSLEGRSFQGAAVAVSGRKIEITNLYFHRNSNPAKIRIAQKFPKLEELPDFGRIPIDVRTALQDEDLLPISPSPEAFLIIPIEQLQSLEPNDPIVGKQVAIQGRATIEGFSNSQQYSFYLQDETGGIATFQPKSLISIFSIESLLIVGTVAIQNETAWLYSGAPGFTQIIERNPELPEPEIRTIEELLENPKTFEGRLVKIQNVSLIPDSEGWPDSLTEGTMTIRENDSEKEIDLLKSRGNLLSKPAFPADIVAVFTRFDPFEENKPRLLLHNRYPAEPTPGFFAWQNRFFEKDENGFPENSAPESDPDGDGIANLLEYAFGGNPHKPNDAFLPKISMEDGNPEILFRRVKEANDLIYEVEASEDLVSWETIWSSLDFPYDSHLSQIEEQVRLESKNENNRRQFLRLRISDRENP